MITLSIETLVIIFLVAFIIGVMVGVELGKTRPY
jgi:hypothetical protein